MFVNMLEASTENIKDETSVLFLKGFNYKGISVSSKPYGFFISFPNEMTDFDELRKDAAIPSDLVDLIEYAAKHEAYYINLDTDAKPVTELPTYGW
ncbi:MAG: hypothetical protein KBT36_08925 [Kurthia sp.]|nr:hypothetical protein [Candidatus Kurthia equi]